MSILIAVLVVVSYLGLALEILTYEMLGVIYVTAIIVSVICNIVLTWVIRND